MAATVDTHQHEPGGKGLKAGALGFVSSVVIGVASTAPGYSLAASLGFVVAAVGLQAPAIMFLAFLPMLFIAAAYYYLNRADPDCGTTFAWVTRAMGPQPAGSAAGASSWPTSSSWPTWPRSPASTPSCCSAPTAWPSTLLGHRRSACVFIAVMTWICYVGIEAVGHGPSSSCSGPRSIVARASSRWWRSAGSASDDAGRAAITPSLAGSTRSPSSAVSGLADRDPARGVHLLGLGHRRHRQRGDRGLHRDAGQRGDGLARSSWSASTSSSRSPPRRSHGTAVPGRELRRRVLGARAATFWGHLWTSC